MIVVRFKAQCKPDKAEEALAMFTDVVRASQSMEGCISFDMGRDLLDPNTFLAIEVYEDQAAVDRQESLPETANAIERLGDLLAAEPDATTYNVTSSEPWVAPS
jgi:quinol monooxygenase YgiN